MAAGWSRQWATAPSNNSCLLRDKKIDVKSSNLFQSGLFRWLGGMDSETPEEATRKAHKNESLGGDLLADLNKLLNESAVVRSDQNACQLIDHHFAQMINQVRNLLFHNHHHIFPGDVFRKL